MEEYNRRGRFSQLEIEPEVVACQDVGIPTTEVPFSSLGFKANSCSLDLTDDRFSESGNFMRRNEDKIR